MGGRCAGRKGWSPCSAPQEMTLQKHWGQPKSINAGGCQKAKITHIIQPACAARHRPRGWVDLTHGALNRDRIRRTREIQQSSGRVPGAAPARRRADRQPACCLRAGQERLRRRRQRSEGAPDAARPRAEIIADDGDDDRGDPEDSLAGSAATSGRSSARQKRSPKHPGCRRERKGSAASRSIS